MIQTRLAGTGLSVLLEHRPPVNQIGLDEVVLTMSAPGSQLTKIYTCETAGSLPCVPTIPHSRPCNCNTIRLHLALQPSWKAFHVKTYRAHSVIGCPFSALPVGLAHFVTNTHTNTHSGRVYRAADRRQSLKGREVELEGPRSSIQ